MNVFTEERLGELIMALPPPPDGWVQAATQLPGARQAIDELVILASRDRETRDVILADLEQALRRVGVEPRPQLMEALRAGLGEL